MSDNISKVEEILNQVGYRGYVAGQQKDSKNADNLMEQSEISIKRATQALTTLIEKEVDKALMRLDDAYSRNLPELVNNEKIASVKQFHIEVWGERCKTKDTEDFPELLHSDGRCPSCKAWETYDSWSSKLKKGEK